MVTQLHPAHPRHITRRYASRPAHDHLRAVPCRGDTGGVMHRQAYDARLGVGDLSHVDAHANADHTLLRPRRSLQSSLASTAASVAAAAVGNVTKNESPSVPRSDPACAATAERMSCW